MNIFVGDAALSYVIWIAAGACIFAWVASLVTREFSWVDRSWSVLPAVYLAVFALHAGLHNVRLDDMATLGILWGVRLTFNFARKGGYSGTEDYRWAVLRARMSKGQFQLFNIFFIVLYQNAILVLISLPALSADEHRTSFTAVDGLLTVLFVVLLVGETVADQQQWDFHQYKSAQLAAGLAPTSQFATTGLFRYSRHPNYFFEIAQWWVIFGFALSAATNRAWLSGVGAVLLTILFIGSTRFTESISLSKYPEYAQYQSRTSPVVPWKVRQKTSR